MPVNYKIKSIAKFISAYSGLFKLSRMLTKQRIRIAVWHKICGPNERSEQAVSAQMFERQLQYLKTNFYLYSLPELARRLKNKETIKKPAAAITIDDGHLGFYRWGYPVLVKHRAPATLYVVSSAVDRGDWLWFDKLDFLRHQAQAIPEFSTVEFPKLVMQLMKLSVAECDRKLKCLAEKAGCALPISPPEQYALASWNQLREMAESGFVDIGAHTVSHQILAAVEPEVAKKELSQCREDIRNRLGIAPMTFCFPNGLAGDYGPEHLDMLAEAGYLCAVASHFGYVSSESHLFALPRVGACTSDFLLFCKYLDGFEWLQRHFLDFLD
ncbi:MAG: polysaccharide deacetylase family protein [Desulfobacteraceae bacterium]|nr:polysaccharide deacetylase family protein [Desulfobacteraceae bacterium]